MTSCRTSRYASSILAIFTSNVVLLQNQPRSLAYNDTQCHNCNDDAARGITNGISTSSLVVVKMGGSAVTVKNSFETIRADALTATAMQIKSVLQDNRINLIVVHGAGSFGHFQVNDSIITFYYGHLLMPRNIFI